MACTLRSPPCFPLHARSLPRLSSLPSPASSSRPCVPLFPSPLRRCARRALDREGRRLGRHVGGVRRPRGRDVIDRLGVLLTNRGGVGHQIVDPCRCRTALQLAGANGTRGPEATRRSADAGRLQSEAGDDQRKRQRARAARSGHREKRCRRPVRPLCKAQSAHKRQGECLAMRRGAGQKGASRAWTRPAPQRSEPRGRDERLRRDRSRSAARGACSGRGIERSRPTAPSNKTIYGISNGNFRQMATACIAPHSGARRRGGIHQPAAGGRTARAHTAAVTATKSAGARRSTTSSGQAGS